MTHLAQRLAQSPYQAYAYAYPHKTAYRPLCPPVPLREAWSEERKDALFLYLHVPFCEMRCGFCNLFTTANPKQDFTAAYLNALRRQAERVRAAIGPATYASMAIGGGTPTFLDLHGIDMLFTIADDLFGVQCRSVSISVETSPHTAEAAKLRLLSAHGVDRISIGVQSFVEAEVKAVGRAQKTAEVEGALERIRTVGFPTLNIDLIYGMPGQTVESWLGSLRAALHFAPEELYLYPLYVRPLTGLGRSQKAWDDIRLACYRAGRSFLLENGYTQISMRMFRKTNADIVQKVATGPVYCCQEDGMVGLGCGARSYTHRLHYSTEYAVAKTGVRAILADYITKTPEAFDVADYGFVLDAADQRRRYVISSLLQTQGLALADYRRRFGSEALCDLPELLELLPYGLATCTAVELRLTDAGLERSDTIGPWLYSDHARVLMEAYELR